MGRRVVMVVMVVLVVLLAPLPARPEPAPADEGALRALGRTRLKKGDLAGAREAWTHRLEILSRRQDVGAEAECALELGAVLWHLGEHLESADVLERARAGFAKVGNEVLLARTWGTLGLARQCMGELASAREAFEAARELFRKLGQERAVAATDGNLGIVHAAAGDYAAALRAHERCLGLMRKIENRPGEARALGNLASVHDRLGDHALALETFERSQRLFRALDDPRGLAANSLNMGCILVSMGETRKALAAYEDALAMFREQTWPPGVARALHNLGGVHESLGASEEAGRCFEASRAMFERMRDPCGVAGNLIAIARLRPTEAVPLLLRALETLEGVDAATERVEALAGLSEAYLARGEAKEAVDQARLAVRAATRLFARLAEEQGARARTRWEGVFAAGVRAALRTGSAADLAWFLESGRAGGLTEFLGGRGALREAVVPAELRRAEVAAHERVAQASAALQAARAGGNVSATRAAGQALRVAEERFRAVVDRVQREVKWSAMLAYREPDSLVEIRSRLGPSEALVLYALLPEEAAALVVERGGSRVVRLGSTDELLAACERLSWSLGPGTRGLDLGTATARMPDPTRAVAVARARLVAPLGLGESVTRVLVSPHGALSLVPLVLLVDREVAYVPSGTTHGILLKDGGKRGEGVLALGDPESVGRLERLPATREEALAVGDVTLLGKRATEAGLVRALGTRPRWRAVHLACHGLIDPRRPTLSALALTPDARDDGLLTCLEVIRTEIPADLVVLSACETLRGKSYRAEGVVGPTRAFLVAGSPRVLASLWKVDDEATRVLMTRFYALWDPRDGSPGIAAATALARAQAHVRSRPAWKHPVYWAAWQLWGLPD